jgi:hypothetical protein
LSQWVGRVVLKAWWGGGPEINLIDTKIMLECGLLLVGLAVRAGMYLQATLTHFTHSQRKFVHILFTQTSFWEGSLVYSWGLVVVAWVA